MVQNSYPVRKPSYRRFQDIIGMYMLSRSTMITMIAWLWGIDFEIIDRGLGLLAIIRDELLATYSVQFPSAIYDPMLRDIQRMRYNSISASWWMQLNMRPGKIPENGEFSAYGPPPDGHYCSRPSVCGLENNYKAVSLCHNPNLVGPG